MKKQEHAIPIIPTKVVEPMVGITTQPVKLVKVPLTYPCIIYFSFEHHAFDCSKKTKIQKIFQINPTTTTTIVTKPFKPNNILINIVVTITKRSQVP
jgi:hypothetical protein